MNGGYKRFLLMLLMAVLCFSGCGSDRSEVQITSPESAAAAEYKTDDIYLQDNYVQEAASEEETGTNDNQKAVTDNRKLIKNVAMSVETEEFDTLIARLESKTEAFGGYIENMDLYNGSSSYGKSDRTAGMTIRIPKDSLDEFVTEVSDISNVVSRNESATDVTMQYVDLESRKKALNIEQDRLIELLGKAETMKEIIALEERLSEVRYELESMEAQLRTYDNLVDYSTVQIDIMEVMKLTPVEERSALDRMKYGFADSWKNLVWGLKNFVIVLVILLPYILFCTLVILSVILIIRSIIKRNALKAKKHPQQRLQPQENRHSGLDVPLHNKKDKNSETDK